MFNEEKSMVNVNYRRGRAKEYRLKKKYEKKGFIVLRTAGSHGFADLIAIKQDGFFNHIVFIQAKPKNFNKKESERLYKKYVWINEHHANVEFLIE